MAWFEGYSQQELVMLGCLSAVLILCVFTLAALKKSPAKTDDAGLHRLNDLMQQLTAQLAEAQRRNDEERAQLHQTVTQLQAELHHVQAQVTELGALVLAGAAESGAEKKTKLAEQFLAVAEEKPVAPPLTVAPATQESLAQIQQALVELKTPPPLTSGSMSSGLEKTRTQLFSRLKSIFTGRGLALSKDSLDELEELLISSDLGVKATKKLLDRVTAQGEVTESTVRGELMRFVEEALTADTPPEIVPVKRNGEPLVVLVVGVNGVGKTTTIAKLAHQFKAQGAKVLVGAADTFRAAAAEQLEVWAERVGVAIVTGPDGTKPTTIAYQAVHRGKEEGFDVVIIDTAGRLHTRVNLMNELAGVVSLIGREQAGAPHETILVVDATTGQNALQQAREFHDKVTLSGVVVTKLDGTPKGGIVVAIKEELGIPIRYVGLGETVEALRTFDAKEFTEALFEEGSSDGEAVTSGVPRRRRREDSVANGV